MKYKRILLKLSGEALVGNKAGGIDPEILIKYSNEIKKIYDNLSLLKKWNSYEMSNFEYLMELNHLSGRSYSDVTQFPVFPWVLINFTNKLSLSDPTNYRDLSLPMGAMGSE